MKNMSLEIDECDNLVYYARLNCSYFRIKWSTMSSPKFISKIYIFCPVRLPETFWYSGVFEESWVPRKFFGLTLHIPCGFFGRACKFQSVSKTPAPPPKITRGRGEVRGRYRELVCDSRVSWSPRDSSPIDTQGTVTPLKPELRIFYWIKGY